MGTLLSGSAHNDLRSCGQRVVRRIYLFWILTRRKFEMTVGSAKATGLLTRR
jgi:hypothetical protein